MLLQVGTGFILFYAPIFFTQQVGLSATLVGLGLGSAQQLSGIVGRFAGGAMADLPRWGRRRTLLLSAAVSALADVVLALTVNFPIFIAGNLLLGLGVGLYWPAAESAIADITTPAQRNEAYALTRFADALGLGVGVILGGAVVATSQNYRLLYVADGISFVAFFAVIYWVVAETRRSSPKQEDGNWFEGWLTALRDPRLLVYLVVNVMFTAYISQIQTTMPLYFATEMPTGAGQQGVAPIAMTVLFTGHVALAALVQLPLARSLNRLVRTRALMLSMSAWAVGFVLMWLTGFAGAGAAVVATLALGVLSVGMASYLPSASSLVADIAPESMRGAYTSLNSQCWAIGYFVGPPLGGWAMDRGGEIAVNFWLAAAVTTIAGVAILRGLERILQNYPAEQS